MSKALKTFTEVQGIDKVYAPIVSLQLEPIRADGKQFYLITDVSKLNLRYRKKYGILDKSGAVGVKEEYWSINIQCSGTGITYMRFGSWKEFMDMAKKGSTVRERLCAFLYIYTSVTKKMFDMAKENWPMVFPICVDWVSLSDKIGKDAFWAPWERDMTRDYERRKTEGWIAKMKPSESHTDS